MTQQEFALRGQVLLVARQNLVGENRIHCI